MQQMLFISSAVGDRTIIYPKDHWQDQASLALQSCWTTKSRASAPQIGWTAMSGLWKHKCLSSLLTKISSQQSIGTRMKTMPKTLEDSNTAREQRIQTKLTQKVQSLSKKATWTATSTQTRRTHSKEILIWWISTKSSATKTDILQLSKTYPMRTKILWLVSAYRSQTSLKVKFRHRPWLKSA